jgi:type II secretory pathway component GspD/PulD (secretin)/tetratricopeptide (TPR) repeat protein
MTRLINLVQPQYLFSTLLTYVVVASVTFVPLSANAQDSGGEPPVTEEEDDIVIPDDPESDEVVEEEVVEEEVVEEETEEDVESEIELEEEPEPTPEEIEKKQQEESRKMEIALGHALVAEAQSAANSGRWREAASKYLEANSYLPNDPSILQGLQEAYSMLDQGPLLDQYEQQLQMEREAARAMFDAAMNSANQRLSREDFDFARREVEKSIVRLERNDRRLFSESEFNQRMMTAKTLLAQIAQQQEQWQQQRLMIEAQEKSAAQSKRQLEETRKRAELIHENMKRVRQLQMEQKYDQALDMVNEILFLDEHNAAALALRDALRATKLYRDFGKSGRESEFGFSEQGVDNEAAKIPPRKNMSGPGDRSTSGIMTYPTDWNDLTNRRLGSVSGFSDSYEDRKIKVAMEQTIGENFSIGDSETGDTEELQDVFDRLEKLAGTVFFIDWPRLEDADVQRNTPIMLQLGNVPLSVVLERVLDQISILSGEDIAYEIQGGILEISTKEALNERTVIEVYNITDLLFEIRDFDDAPVMGSGGGGGGGGGGGSGGGGGGSGAGGGGGSGGGGGGSGGGGSGGTGGGPNITFSGGGEEPERKTPEEMMEDIIGIIEKHVDPDSWVDDAHSIDMLNSNLIISQTPRNHRLIMALLAKLREVRALQLNVEGRFLSISTDWFEQIGFDLDLYFNTNDKLFTQMQDVDPNARLSDFFVPGTGQMWDPVYYAGVTTDPETGEVTSQYPNSLIPTYWLDSDADPDNPGSQIYTLPPLGNPAVRHTSGFSPLGLVQNHNQLLKTVGSYSTFASSIVNANPALGFGMQFLDDVQVDLLIEATQADSRNTILTAPRLTLHNGQIAWISVQTSQTYVSSLNVNSNSGAIGYSPVISNLLTGFSFKIHGVISADRRYVTMEVVFDIGDLVSMEKSDAFTGVAGGSGSGGSGSTAATGSAYIDLPIVLTHQVRTTVSVPDKGTALLGGQRSVREYETEIGVPILSKIPYVNRFFTNKTTSREETTLLLLLRPEIIIQQENEAMLFSRSTLDAGSNDSFLR